MKKPSEIIIKGKTLEEILKLHKMWLNGEDGGIRANLSGANLRGVDLEGANLRGVDLEDADLEGANLDFSCMPLWCGDLKANYDDKQVVQQLYHVLSHVKYSKNVSQELKRQLLTIENIDIANKFHRVMQCGGL